MHELPGCRASPAAAPKQERKQPQQEPDAMLLDLEGDTEPHPQQAAAAAPHSGILVIEYYSSSSQSVSRSFWVRR